jgi:hypothetical protein
MKNYHIRPLPFWVLTDLQPAFYDSESGTVLQQLSRIYPKIQEVIDSYNDFVREVNRYIDEFENGIIKDFNCFKNCIIKTMNDYIESIDMKLYAQDTNISNRFNEQDKAINEAIDYMKDNLTQTINNLFNEALSNGDIVASLNIDYTSNTESLVLSIVAESEGE